MNDLEQRLQRQSLKEIPPAWRAEILMAATQAAPRPAPAVSWITTKQQLVAVFWPHPKAWAGLAALWLVILVLHFSIREPEPRMVENSGPPSPEQLVELRQQQRLFAELIGPSETGEADRRKMFTPKPRSERGEMVTV